MQVDAEVLGSQVRSRWSLAALVSPWCPSGAFPGFSPHCSREPCLEHSSWEHTALVAVGAWLPLWLVPSLLRDKPFPPLFPLQGRWE